MISGQAWFHTPSCCPALCAVVRDIVLARSVSEQPNGPTARPDSVGWVARRWGVAGWAVYTVLPELGSTAVRLENW